MMSTIFFGHFAIFLFDLPWGHEVAKVSVQFGFVIYVNIRFFVIRFRNAPCLQLTCVLRVLLFFFPFFLTTLTRFSKFLRLGPLLRTTRVIIKLCVSPSMLKYQRYIIICVWLQHSTAAKILTPPNAVDCTCTQSTVCRGCCSRLHQWVRLQLWRVQL